MKIKKTILFQITTAAIIICGMLYLNAFTSDDLYDRKIGVFISEQYAGKVTKKYIDNSNHNDYVIVLASGKRLTYYGEIWRLVAVGDSLVKIKNKPVLAIFKKGKMIEFDGVRLLNSLKRKMQKK